MGYTPAGYADGGSYTFHFPDGNASIARLLVRGLVPGAIAGPGLPRRRDAPGRLRAAWTGRPTPCASACPASACGRAICGDDGARAGVRGRLCARRARSSRVQAQGVRARLLEHDDPLSLPRDAARRRRRRCTSWSRRRWSTPASRCATGARSSKLGVAGVTAPGGYHSSFRLNWPVDIGGYASRALARQADPGPHDPHALPAGPDRSSTRTAPAAPNCWRRRSRPSSAKIRDQLGRTLAGGGFDPARDITAHHRQPLAARLCARIQPALRCRPAGRSAAQRHRPRPLRPHRHRQLRRRPRPPTPTAPSTRPTARWANC